MHNARAKPARARITSAMFMAATVLCAQQQAHAFPVTITVTGQLALGSIDKTGVSGEIGPILRGTPFTAVFTLDTADGTSWTIIGVESPCNNGLQNNVSTKTSAKLTLEIKGHPYTWSADGASTVNWQIGYHNLNTSQITINIKYETKFNTPIPSTDTFEVNLVNEGKYLSFACVNWDTPATYAVAAGQGGFNSSSGYEIDNWTSTEPSTVVQGAVGVFLTAPGQIAIRSP